MRPIIAAAALLLLTIPALAADDRHAIFIGQAQQMANVGEEAEGLVRCGIRSPQWSGRIQQRAIISTAVLATRIWPPGPSGDDGFVAYHAALVEAERLLDAATDRGRHVKPEWCVDTGPAAATLLDELLK
jgi:hypothetical protein